MINNEELNLQDVEKILKEHSEFYRTEKTFNIDFRINQLNKLKQGIKKYEIEIIKALNKDLGKHEFESYTTEIGFVLLSIKEAIKNLKKWSRPKKVKTPIYLFPAKGVIISEPYGTILIIGPYNYPFQLLIEPLIGAIAAGNCAVIKPSEIAENVSKVVTKMISDVFDKRYIRCVEGTIQTNTSLINSKFDYIFFTGSVGVGKVVMEAAAKNLIPLTLELGGKSPVIVDKTANIKVAARRIIWGKIINAGQTCIAPDYLLVHESVKQQLIAEMINSIKQFFKEDVKKSNDFGRIINQKHFYRIKSIIEKDEEGIVYGGSTDENDKYIEPTIIEISSWNCACMSEEIFGPVLPVLTYSDLDKAIDDIRKLPKPLALYLFTCSKDIERKVLRKISSGGVCINDTITHIANPYLPFGGVGNAGMGSYHGEQSFITFSHRKSILTKTNIINITMLFPPYNKNKLNLIKKIMK